MIHPILFEYAGTSPEASPHPVGLWKGQVDWRETRTVERRTEAGGVLSEAPRFELRNVELPEWMPPEEWMPHADFWDRFWALGLPFDAPESWHRRLSALSGWQALACIRLLSTHRFGSRKRAALCERLEAWLAAKSPSSSPFTFAEWSLLLTASLKKKAERLGVGSRPDFSV